MEIDPTVFVVDDDPDSRKSVCALVRSMGMPAEAYASAEAFLESDAIGRRGCLVTDVRMLGMTGLELQSELNRRGVRLPVIVITAYARTPMTVQAIKAGAVTLLEKPYENDDLWDAIREALAQDVSNRSECEFLQEIRRRFSELTASERQVMQLMIQGKANKLIARQLEVSLRTVESRRREVFQKMKAESLAELVRMAIDAELGN